ncbi:MULTISPECIES: fumarylacetoacetate hydrolase family protein [unclassified Rhodococcus (in: high G+C Gram-positive bacteria)]|uniref:fumarylacetoacetate hydrolase family protein n=1 Tax=unclassified Rhodococcus (in: high G+C Gram-positive bacteria) TaxID=192944 RepID=UPI001639A6AA|nr:MULTISPECIES: fumarylacetoacetate hydrolase family protein [unclassified Rhodococcus (in: high G+C Gram-positive bacteria)]MBC2637753.1 fumarylacetoacetate hydrolase family protein [Rhodococcus sp. 3A]MBC2897502.1 fumarylacetoacetate hydrolase family protein [Rhodococcus sp. 4CII]
MKLLSFTTLDGRRGVGVLTEEGVRVVGSDQDRDAAANVSPMRALLERTAGDVQAVADELPSAELISLEDLTVDVPVPDPSKIIAAPVNYENHKVEMNQSVHISALGLFLKSPQSLLAHESTVRLPYTDRRFDQEGELAVVIGKKSRGVAVDGALDVVAGYSLLLDITMRGGEDRSTRKSFDTFTPMGPCLVTPDEVGSLSDLQLTCAVDGQLRQSAPIADLIWGVPQLIAYASSVMTLLPGDVIATGTPAGVGQVRDGQDIAVDMQGFDTLRVKVSDLGAVPCPTRGARQGPVAPSFSTPVSK